MRTPRAVFTAALTSLTVLAAGVLASPTWAGVTYSEVTSFGSGQVANPVGVAVDQASGQVYVASAITGAPLIDRFDAAGSILPPSPFGSGAVVSFLGYVFSGVAVNPTSRDLYAVEGNGVSGNVPQIQTYNSTTGALLSHFSVAGSGNIFGGLLTVVQIASDTAGNVYLPNAPNNEVQEFDPQGNVLATLTGAGGEALKEPTGVAVAPYGNVYVADNGNGRMEEFSPGGAFIMAIGAGVNQTTGGEVCMASSGDTCGPGADGTQSVALGAGGEIFLGENNGSGFHVVLYSPSGEKLDDFGLGTIGSSGIGAINSLAVGPNGAVYVADGGDSVVRVYAQQTLQGRPSILSASATVEHFTAILRASIAQGLADTAYRFEYGPTSAYGASIPVSDQDIGNGLDGPATVAQEVTGLKPGTTYHYRVVASNALGVTAGPDQMFTTLPPQPPAVSTRAAEGVAQNSATLTGTIETQGFETTYEFDIGVDTSYGTRIFGDAGVEAGVNTYRVPLQGLMPGTTYHYRVVATNLFGTTYGADETFTTGTYPTAALAAPEALPLLPTRLLAPAGGAGVKTSGVKTSAAHAARHARARASGRGQRPRHGRHGAGRTGKGDGRGGR
jgi:NHL repeat